MTTKPDATNGRSSKWGKDAGKASVLTWGDLSSGCGSSNPDPEVRLRRQGSAEAIVPSPLRWEGPNIKEDEYFEQFEGRARKTE
jgi:hypothetical protein